MRNHSRGETLHGRLTIGALDRSVARREAVRAEARESQPLTPTYFPNIRPEEQESVLRDAAGLMREEFARLTANQKLELASAVKRRQDAIGASVYGYDSFEREGGVSAAWQRFARDLAVILSRGT